MVIGAVIIKHKLTLSDEETETVLQIQENPYLQYFIGLSRYQEEPAFAPSQFVEIRRRMGSEVFAAFEKAILTEIEKSRKKQKSDKEDQGPPSHKGKLVIDATVAEQAIRYPTDLGLLNESREISEHLIDELAKGSGVRKPRTYREQAKKRYLTIAKNMKPGRKLIRKGIRQQLLYLRRNLSHIDRLLDACDGFPLSSRKQKQYWVIQQVYSQQLSMYRNRSCRCDDRIVSIHQPHVRPVIRGKGKSGRSLAPRSASIWWMGSPWLTTSVGMPSTRARTCRIRLNATKIGMAIVPRRYLPTGFMAPGTTGSTCRGQRASGSVANHWVDRKSRRG
ncbi:hypothetical protein JCM39068_43760 [Desulfocastanea catecholica]